MGLKSVNANLKKMIRATERKRKAEERQRIKEEKERLKAIAKHEKEHQNK